MKFVVDGIPKALMRPRFGRGRFVYDPSKSDKAVLSLGIKHGMILCGVKMFEGDVVVKLDFFGCSGRPDLDNLIKLFLDAGNNVLFKDDRQVVEINARKIRHDARPRTEVEITPHEPGSMPRL